IQNFEFLTLITQDVKKLAGNKPFYCAAEYIPEDPIITVAKNGPMDGLWHEKFYTTIKDILIMNDDNNRVSLDQLKLVIDGRLQGYSSIQNLVNYLSNHDHNRFCYDIFTHIKDEQTAINRLKLGKK
ncbi:unnamed protein product, partial [Didymodactylos carnosus]